MVCKFKILEQGLKVLEQYWDIPVFFPAYYSVWVAAQQENPYVYSLLAVCTLWGFPAEMGWTGRSWISLNFLVQYVERTELELSWYLVAKHIL